MQFRERLFEGQLVVGQEGLLAAEGDLGGLGAVDNTRSCLAAGCYAVAELLDLSDVCIVPAGDEVLIALAACAMLAHDLDQRVGRTCGGLRRVKGDPQNTILRFHSRPTNKKCIMALVQMMQERMI